MTFLRTIDKAGTVRPFWPDVIAGSVCAVTLVNRQTGDALRVNGSRVIVYTRAPGIAAEELLSGRDPGRWDVRVQPLDPARQR